MQTRDYAILVVLAAIWGLSYVFIRVASPLLGPGALMEFRVLIAGAVLLVYVVAVRRPRGSIPDFRHQAWPYFVMGALNAALPFTLIAVSELNLTASYAAIINATAPLFSAITGVFWLGHVVSARAAAGLATGLAGVVVAVGLAPFSVTPIVLFSVGASLMAGASYGVGAQYIERRFREVSPLALSIGLQLTAGAWLLPLATLEAPAVRVTMAALVSLFGLALLSTVIAYGLYFHLLRAAGPTETLTVTFLIPIFGVVWGHLLLGDPLGVGALAGLAIVLLGVGLVTRSRSSPTSSSPPAPSAESSAAPMERS